jgi:hypothetical protein
MPTDSEAKINLKPLASEVVNFLQRTPVHKLIDDKHWFKFSFNGYIKGDGSCILRGRKFVFNSMEFNVDLEGVRDDIIQ